MTDNDATQASSSASPSLSLAVQGELATPINGVDSGSAAVTKRVQVVGAPPPFYGAGRKEEETRQAAESDNEDEEQPDDDVLGIDGADKTRTVGDGEVKDEDLLAEFDEDEDVSRVSFPLPLPDANDGPDRRCT